MSKSVSTLVGMTSGEDVVQYLANIASMETIARCVQETKNDEGIYKLVASFEDHGIVEASEVPLGDVKTKLNHLLKEAVAKSTSLLNSNLNIAGKIAKAWSDNTLISNQQERLNGSLAKLYQPVKTNPMPSYSNMTETQRTRTAATFQKIMGSAEPVSIDFITEAIDRYNAGADNFVMFRVLDITVEYGNAVGTYDSETYQKLMDETVFHYLASRFISYAEICQTIAPVTGGDTTKHSLANIRELLISSRATHNKEIYSRIKGLGEGISFTQPMDEYQSNYKETTSHANLKQYIGNKNLVTPLSKNETDRLDAVCKAVNNMTNVTFPVVDTAASSADNDELYEILSLYFSFIEELTQSLYTFMFVAQVATRNNELIEGVIGACDAVVVKIKLLFDTVSNNLPDDSSVSQEEITANVNYVKSKAPAVPTVKDEELLPVYAGLKATFKQAVDASTRIKLRGYSSISIQEATDFKNKHSKTIKDLMGVDISELGGEDLFNLISSNFFSGESKFLSDSVLSLDLFDQTLDLSQALIYILSTPHMVTDLFKTPFGMVSTKTYESAIDDMSDHLFGVKEAIEDSDMELIKSRLNAFDYFLNQGSYFTNIAKLTDHGRFNTLRQVPSVPCLYKDDTTYTVGYNGLDRSSQDMLANVFEIPKESSIRLSDLNNEAVDIVTDAYDVLRESTSSEASSKTLLKRLEVCLKVVGDIRIGLEKLDIDYEVYGNVLDSIQKDITDATSDVQLRASLVHLLYHTSYSTVNCLSDFYRTSNQLLTDFVSTYS